MKKTYSVLRLHTRAGDDFIGQIAYCSFFGNKLKIKMSVAPLLRIERHGDPERWIVVSQRRRYSFTFKRCVVTKDENQVAKNGPDLVEVTSSEEDVVTLSNKKEDIDALRLLAS